MFLNSMPRLDVLSDDDLATLDAGWERLQPARREAS
jgi:hypothetical protein